MKKYFLLLYVVLLYTSSYAIELPSYYKGGPFTLASYEDHELPIVAIVPTYNNKDWYDKNLSSIFQQKYSNYKLIIIDDCSSDGTTQLIEEYLKTHDHHNKCTYIKNKIRKYKMANLYYAIHTCDNNAIIAVIDGDDWLLDTKAFSYINELYSSSNIWLTAGGYIEYPSGKECFCRPIPNEIIQKNNFRNYFCTTSQFRTFYAGLFKQISLAELFFEGRFYRSASDIAKMMPMFELAGERIAYNYRKLYVYNLANTINDHKVDPLTQAISNNCVLKSPKRRRIESFSPTAEDLVSNAKADIIVIADNPDQLDQCLAHISNIHDNNKIIVIADKYAHYQNAYEACKVLYHQFIFIFETEITPQNLMHHLQHISESEFIFLLKNTSIIRKHIELNYVIRLLERTNAYCWQSKKAPQQLDKNYSDISPQVYAFQFGQDNADEYIAHNLDKALYRKKDIIAMLGDMQSRYNQNSSFEKNFNSLPVIRNTIALFSGE